MDTIEITVRVNKVNAERVKEVGTAHNGTLDDDKTAHALATASEPSKRKRRPKPPLHGNASSLRP
jgi:hypothetical protein